MNWYLIKLNHLGQVEKIFAGPFHTEGEAIDELNNFHKLINNKLENVVPGQIIYRG